MIKAYKKVATIQAEQFDGSDEMIEKYHIRTNTVYELDPEYRSFDDIVPYQIETLEGFIELDPGDWIATGISGEHWPIANDIFKKTYVEVGNDKKIVKKAMDRFADANESIGYANGSITELINERIHARNEDDRNAFNSQIECMNYVVSECKDARDKARADVYEKFEHYYS